MKKTSIKSKTNFLTFLLLTIFGITSVNIMGQSIMEYYIPSQLNFNKASFYSTSNEGERTEATRVIFYSKNNDESYDVKDVHSFQGQTTATETQTVQFTTNSVVMIKSSSSSLFYSDKRQTYNPPRIILKKPAKGQVATWTVPGENGGKPTKYTSSWTTVVVEGVSKTAIKIVSQYTGWAEKTISYYVKGIGLYKTEYKEKDGKITPFENFDGLSYE